MTGIIQTGGLPGRFWKLTNWLIASGIFLLLHALIMDRESLQSPWITMHLTLLGVLGAALFSAPSGKVRMGFVLAIAAASFGLTWIACRHASKETILFPGWIALVAVGSWIVVRGGVR